MLCSDQLHIRYWGLFVEIFHGIFQALKISTNHFRGFFSIFEEVESWLQQKSFSISTLILTGLNKIT